MRRKIEKRNEMKRGKVEVSFVSRAQEIGNE